MRYYQLNESPEMQAGFAKLATLLTTTWVQRIMSQRSPIGDIDNLAAGSFIDTFENGRNIRKLPEELRAFVKHAVKRHLRLVAREQDSATNGHYFSHPYLQPEIVLYFDPEMFQSAVEQIRQRNPSITHNLLNTRRSTLVHELRHAYDDFESKGMYGVSPEAQQADSDKRTARTDPSAENLQRADQSYLLQPHEISARYTQAVEKISRSVYGPWKDYSAQFKQNFRGWYQMPASVKMRLLKRLGREWANEHSNPQPTDIVPFIRKLDAKLKAGGSQIMLFPAHGNIEVWGLERAPPKDQADALQQAAYLADIFRRQVVTSDDSPMLGSFGFVRNKGRNIDYRISARYRRPPKSRR